MKLTVVQFLSVYSCSFGFNFQKNKGDRIGLLPHVSKVHAAEQRGNQWKGLVTKHSMVKGTKR